MSDAANVQAGRRSGGVLDFLLSFRGVLLFWILYGVLHSVLRINISRTLTLDDSRANELVQTLSLGYQVRQPPLYEWLLWFSQQALGTGIESHLLVRYGLIAALGIVTYGAVRAAANCGRWGAAGSYSLVLSYPVGWTFHEWATQTILLCIACMATLHAAVKFLKAPKASEAVFLGLAVAFGFHAKFSFPIFLGALVLAVASIPEIRGRLADRKLLIPLFITLAAIAPYLFWVAMVKGSIASEVTAHMIQEQQSHLMRMLIGLARLAKSIFLFLLPWAVFVFLLLPSAFLSPASAKSPAGLGERLAWRTMLIAAALAATGIAVAGATNIAERYMHPILIVAPVFAFARIARFADSAELVRRSVAFSVGAAIVLLVFRFAAATDNPVTKRLGRGLLIPYVELSEVLRQKGIVDGTVVTSRVRDAGNLRANNPMLRVKAQESYLAVPPPRRESDRNSCILLWGDGEDEDISNLVPLAGLQREKIEIAKPPSRIFATRSDTWYIARLDPASKYCS